MCYAPGIPANCWGRPHRCSAGPRALACTFLPTCAIRDAVQAGAWPPLKLGENPPHRVTRLLLAVGEGHALCARGRAGSGE